MFPPRGGIYPDCQSLSQYAFHYLDSWVWSFQNCYNHYIHILSNAFNRWYLHKSLCFSANFAVQIPCAHYLYIVLNWLVCWLVRNKKTIYRKERRKELYHLFCEILVGALAVLRDPVAEGLRAATPPLKSHLVYHVMFLEEVAVFILKIQIQEK